MARYVGPKCRQCRREGEKLFLKGEKCYGSKCAMENRAFPPGQHGHAVPVLLIMQRSCVKKQKMRRTYGILETQFRLYYKSADSSKGATGENLLQALESRLDNVVYRMGFCGITQRSASVGASQSNQREWRDSDYSVLSG